MNSLDPLQNLLIAPPCPNLKPAHRPPLQAAFESNDSNEETDIAGSPPVNRPPRPLVMDQMVHFNTHFDQHIIVYNGNFKELRDQLNDIHNHLHI